MVGKLEKLCVFGLDYLMLDGIGVCDYIYVVDFVKGYIVVFDVFVKCDVSFVVNFGIG